MENIGKPRVDTQTSTSTAQGGSANMGNLGLLLWLMMQGMGGNKGLPGGMAGFDPMVGSTAQAGGNPTDVLQLLKMSGILK